MKFESEAAAYEFYNEYGKRNGFGIRREYFNKSKVDGVLTSRRFTCFKEGKRSVDKRRTGEHRAETRTECPARMVISLDRKIEKYNVVDFIAQHNHPLQPPEHVHMIRSHRHISEAQATQIVLGDESGLRPKDLHEYISRQAGGIETVGFTKKDLKNYLQTKRNQTLKHGEVGALMMYFKQESENPSFFYDFQMDDEEQIINIFWADAQMINDYGYFSDVITFDTTYKTNKDCRPLGVFVGLNNHKQTVIFGATLLYDETISSFRWLFETFLKAMSGEKPKTILTDQDAAMAKAISLVMPETFHGLFVVAYNFSIQGKMGMGLCSENIHCRAVDGKRNNESEAEYDSKHKLPKLKMKARMLIHAGDVYTPRIFQEFQEEYEQYQNCYIKDLQGVNSRTLHTTAMDKRCKIGK
ncbi:protein FAR1-related sequence 5-like [Trifolium pratense]|uniref:Protein FAR1-related sequence 5-like n=1 Tax=Trifolium pratense TaxID=57577 RepID=A0A2K3LXA9_TRIPR|nr:protein FAR1-related sequence 5-like [Trifolium pratense]